MESIGMESGGFDWMKWLSAAALVLMLVYLIPRAKQMMEISAQAENKDWKGVIIPLIAVVIFVIFLISLVR